MNEVLLVITVMCNLNTPGIQMPKQEKIDCIEFQTNCLIGENGAYLKDKKQQCQNKWDNQKANNAN
jgi:hypothetical protein